METVANESKVGIQLRRSWGSLGPSWGPLGPCLGPRKRSWSLLGRLLGRLRGCQDWGNDSAERPRGTHRGAPWKPFGGLLARLQTVWGRLGCRQTAPDAMLDGRG
eukprot:59081-Pyramimonas_sp.AAC.1